MPTNKQLEDLWKRIKDGDYLRLPPMAQPEALPNPDGIDRMSIPNSDATQREVYERRKDGEWTKVPFMWEHNPFI
jgi:hypothetical protein